MLVLFLSSLIFSSTFILLSVLIRLNRSKFAILRIVIQDVKQSIFFIESELQSLNLDPSNSFLDFSPFEKRNFAQLEFQSAHHKTILNKKFSSLLNLNFSVSHIFPLVQNSEVNFSLHPLSDSQHNVLSFDLNFSFSPQPDCS